MAKDKRLYMTFPNDFWMHPKIAPLSVEAKWAFVEMNGYSRMQDLDGRIPAVMMHRMWTAEVVAELVGSHDERPLMFHDSAADVYVIRDYAQHQQTTADREELSEKRSIAGKAGRAKQLADNSGASAGQVSGQNWAETELETEKEEPKNSSAIASRDSLFDVAYESWPKKVDRKDAAAKWPRAVREFAGTESELVEIVKAHGLAYATHRAKQFTPSLLVWLNKARWDSELPTAESSSRPMSNADHNLAYLASLMGDEQRQIGGVA